MEAERWSEIKRDGEGIREEREKEREGGRRAVAGPPVRIYAGRSCGVGAGASGGRCRSSGPADAAITCIVYARGSA